MPGDLVLSGIADLGTPGSVMVGFKQRYNVASRGRFRTIPLRRDLNCESAKVCMGIWKSFNQA